MLNFLYYAKYPVHTMETLDLMEEALNMYHTNREVFIDLGIRHDFNFPKDHFIKHYHELIELFGTCDNFNTEYTEHLHIDFAKEAFRATNCKDEYHQMTAWLDHREKVYLHEKFILRRFLARSTPPPPWLPPLVYLRQIKMTSRPSVYGVSIGDIETKYDAIDFRGTLSRFIVHLQNPALPRRQVEDAATNLYIPFSKISVFHHIKFVLQDVFSKEAFTSVVDSIHCEPTRLDKHGKYIPGRFDTAIVNLDNGGRAGVKGMIP